VEENEGDGDEDDVGRDEAQHDDDAAADAHLYDEEEDGAGGEQTHAVGHVAAVQPAPSARTPEPSLLFPRDASGSVARAPSSLDVEPSFGLSGDAGNRLLTPCSASGVSAAPASSSARSTAASPASVFAAVSARATRLRSQIATLRAELDRDVGAVNAQKLLEYFQAQAGQSAAAQQAGDDDSSNVSGAAAAPGGGGGADVEHAFVLSLVPSLSQMDAALTRVYQLIYLQEERARCEAILLLAPPRSTDEGRRVGTGAAAARAVLAQSKQTGDAPAAEGEDALNLTPRVTASAAAARISNGPQASLLSTSNLTLKRDLMLHRRARVATAAPGAPGAAARTASAQRTQPSQAQAQQQSAKTGAAAATAVGPLARTLAPPRAAGAPRSQRQRK